VSLLELPTDILSVFKNEDVRTWKNADLNNCILLITVSVREGNTPVYLKSCEILPAEDDG